MYQCERQHGHRRTWPQSRRSPEGVRAGGQRWQVQGIPLAPELRLCRQPGFDGRRCTCGAMRGELASVTRGPEDLALAGGAAASASREKPQAGRRSRCHTLHGGHSSHPQLPPSAPEMMPLAAVTFAGRRQGHAAACGVRSHRRALRRQQPPQPGPLDGGWRPPNARRPRRFVMAGSLTLSWDRAATSPRCTVAEVAHTGRRRFRTERTHGATPMLYSH